MIQAGRSNIALSAASVVSVGLIIAAAQGGKDSNAMTLLTAIGAAGQALIAVFLWKLSIEQFRFQKEIALRELKAEHFGYRNQVYDTWLDTAPRFMKDVNQEMVTRLAFLQNKVGRIFDAGVIAEFAQIYAQYRTYVAVKEEHENADMDSLRVNNWIAVLKPVFDDNVPNQRYGEGLIERYKREGGHPNVLRELMEAQTIWLQSALQRLDQKLYDATKLDVTIPS